MIIWPKNIKSTKTFLKPMSENSEHKKVLKELLLVWLDSISVKSKSGDKLPCLRGWKMSAKSLISLFDDLSASYDVEYLFPCCLNQDCLENLFSQMRGNNGGVTRPNCAQFKIFFKKALLESTTLSRVVDLSSTDMPGAPASSNDVEAILEILPGFIGRALQAFTMGSPT